MPQFRARGPPRLAVLLGLVAQLEDIPRKAIGTSFGAPVTEYRGRLTPRAPMGASLEPVTQARRGRVVDPPGHRARTGRCAVGRRGHAGLRQGECGRLPGTFVVRCRRSRGSGVASPDGTRCGRSWLRHMLFALARRVAPNCSRLIIQRLTG
jgi:hypothetical protein